MAEKKTNKEKPKKKRVKAKAPAALNPKPKKHKGNPAPLGNLYHEKFKTKESRQQLCTAVIEHLENGYSKQSFSPCDWDTVQRYVEKYPADFPMSEISAAFRKGLLFWEKLGRSGTSGKLKGFNSASWIFNMKNRAGWSDKVEVSGADGGAIKTENKDTTKDPQTLEEAAAVYKAACKRAEK